MANHRKITDCRICGSDKLVLVLDLGSMPPANAFVSAKDLEKPDASFPLAVNFCENCSSVQLAHTVDGTLLFKDYHYVTGASKPLVEHFNKLADEIAGEFARSSDDLVIEIGSNDGSLLARIKDRVRVLGVDPADNVAEIALAKGVPTKIGFFGTNLSAEVARETGRAKVIVANNVMAHIDGLKDVFQGVKDLLTDDGVFIFEVHWVGNLITDGGFDQVYHEHLFYHSVHALKHLLGSLGMVISDVKLVPMHGESLRVYAKKSGSSSQAVKDLLAREKEMGLTSAKTFAKFSEKVEENKNKLLELLRRLKKEGKKVVGYGAPAKGNTLLNYFGIGSDLLDFITDTTPAKQGTYTPGTRIKVVHPEILFKKQPDYIVLLSWNYADAILEKEKELRAKGVKFIVPVPVVRIVE